MSEKENVKKEPEIRRDSFDDFEKSLTHDRPEPQDSAPTSRPTVSEQQGDQGSDTSGNSDKK